MSKIFKLKKWLTISETKRYLNSKLEECIEEADIYQLCLDGHLNLSILFSEPVRATIYEYACHKDEKDKRINLYKSSSLVEFNSKFAESINDEIIKLHLKCINKNILFRDEVEEITRFVNFSYDELSNSSEHNLKKIRDDIAKFKTFIEENKDKIFLPIIDTSEFIELNNGKIYHIINDRMEKYIKLSGVYNLAMVGNERLDIEFLQRQNANLKLPNLICIDGFFVISDDEKYLYNIQTIGEMGNGVDEFYYPAGGIDDIGIADFVCTTKSLKEFEEKLQFDEIHETSLIHSMPLALDIANKAYARYWGNMPDPHDTTQHKTNKIIAEWIIKESKGVITQTMAERIAQIIRPEWAVTGRRKEI